MKNYAKWAALIACCILLASCGLLSPEQVGQMGEAVDLLEYNKSISPSMASAFRELLASNGIGPIWQQGLGYGLAALSAYFGVQWRRGTPATADERVARQQKKLAEKVMTR